MGPGLKSGCLMPSEPKRSRSNKDQVDITFSLDPVDNERLANLYGQLDEHLRLIEKRLGVDIHARGELFRVSGDQEAVQATEKAIRNLYKQTAEEVLTLSAINLHLQSSGLNETDQGLEVGIKTKRGMIRGRGPNQRQYLKNIAEYDVNFGVGPAGTGKTYLAVACAVDALERGEVGG